MRASFQLGRIAGIAIGVHYTWLIAFFLIAWTLAQELFPSWYEGWSRAAYWGTGLLAALLLFASVLLHELAHSLVARSRGLPVRGITLFIFGGVSSLGSEARRAWDEFLIAVVGPLVSLGLAGLFALGWLAVSGQESPLTAIVGYLALVNAMLAVFNLVPGFPLDGGRVLRSILWGVLGSLSRATQVAASVGQAVALVLMGWGILELFSGNQLSGIWVALIGWFLYSAADASRRDALLQRLFRDVPVRKVMDEHPGAIGPEETVEELVRHHFLERGLRALPVQQDDRLVGIVTLSDVKPVPPERWATTRVAEIMTRPPLHAVAPEAPVAEALNLMAVHDVNQLLVVRQERLVGFLRRADIIRYLQVLAELGLEEAVRRGVSDRGPRGTP
ncbi:MAG: site-2 protease family protein [Chloroflexi bacterium]|nr:site-2 protease family protein [Chloroflexota bacterium]